LNFPHIVWLFAYLFVSYDDLENSWREYQHRRNIYIHKYIYTIIFCQIHCFRFHFYSEQSWCIYQYIVTPARRPHSGDGDNARRAPRGQQTAARDWRGKRGKISCSHTERPQQQQTNTPTPPTNSTEQYGNQLDATPGSEPRTASNPGFSRDFCSICIFSCGFDDLEKLSTVKIWRPGNFEDVAACR